VVKTYIWLSAALLVLAGCSQAAPRIPAAQLRLVYRQEDGAVRERFSFFISAEDEDGTEDLAEVYLLHDREQLVWKLTDADWIRVEKSGQTWIGSHDIAMADDASLPRGAYRAVLVDKSGARAERTLAFDDASGQRRAFPSLDLEKKRYAVVSDYPDHQLIVYDEKGGLIKKLPLTTRTGSLADLKLPPAARSVALWAEDPVAGVAAMTDAVPVKDR
jgi:hypothetical protein